MKQMKPLILVLVVLVPAAWPWTGTGAPGQPGSYAPEMPDLSHQLLAEHAAQSHGTTGELVTWIGQGAYDEDHCEFDPYPPCYWWVPNGWHSWDPDTGGFWQIPGWADSGSGLTRADQLFARAVASYAAGEVEAAYLLLGRAVHLLGDMATPAHAHLDTHLPPFDTDPYESWLNLSDKANTRAWITDHPAGAVWDLAVGELPGWENLDADLQAQLESASQAYGGRNSGLELWQFGPEGHDVVVFRLMYLMAEAADDWNSDDVAGEVHNGDLDDPAYLVQMRDTLFPELVRYTTALIDYFESRTASCPGCRAFVPLIYSAP